jgi:peptidoglycan/xylan/chitin deacetylase (PgdA/CDA1 family)
MLVSGPTLRDELRRARQSIQSALARAGAPPGTTLRFFRPPFGFLTEGTAAAAAAEGFVVVLWTVSVGDWRPHTKVEDVVDHVLARVGPGDVVVLHDGERTHQDAGATCADRAVVAPAVRRLVPALAARGLRVAPLSEVLRLPPPA